MLCIQTTQTTLCSSLTSERCKPAGNWDIDPEQTFSISLHSSFRPHHCIFTPASFSPSWSLSPQTKTSISPCAVVEPECDKSSATTYFWYRQTLNTTSTIAESGGLNVKMTLSLFVAWIIVCLAVIKGIASSGKVEEGWWDERKIWRGALVSLFLNPFFPPINYRWCTSALFSPMWCCSVSWSGG